jgi:hypothetical protein
MSSVQGTQKDQRPERRKQRTEVVVKKRQAKYHPRINFQFPIST